MTTIIHSCAAPRQRAALTRGSRAGSQTLPSAAAPRRWLPLILLVALLWSGLVPEAMAAPRDEPEKLYVSLSKSLVLDLGQPVETVSIADTDLADFVVAAKTQVLIHGKKEGITSLVVWVKDGWHREYDLVIQRGFAPKQVLLKVRIAEVNQSKLTEYGIDYLYRRLEPGADRAAGVYSGGVGKPAIPLSAGTLPEYTDEASIVLRWFKGVDNAEIIMRALQQDGLLKIIARPDLVCVDGKEASFLAGGEIPVPVAQTSSAGGTTITVEWREFGARLRFKPTVVDSDLVHLEVEPEVSGLDFTNSVVIGGFVVPGLVTRRAETEVELHEGESFIIGGLKQATERSIKNKIPILGHIPILGYLFRSISKEIEESELLILVSPTIVEPIAKGQPLPVLPGETPPAQSSGAQRSQAPQNPQQQPRAPVGD